MVRTGDKLLREMAALRDLPRHDLARRWERTYGSAPSHGVRAELLLRSAAWHLQAKHLGGLSAETRRLLRSAIAEVKAQILDRRHESDIAVERVDTVHIHSTAVDDASLIAVRSQSATKPKRQLRPLLPGARLLRTWNGRTHVVDVVEGGFRFEEKVYPSLTAVAETITGAHWSGPRFFGR